MRFQCSSYTRTSYITLPCSYIKGRCRYGEYFFENECTAVLRLGHQAAWISHTEIQLSHFFFELRLCTRELQAPPAVSLPPLRVGIIDIDAGENTFHRCMFSFLNSKMIRDTGTRVRGYLNRVGTVICCCCV